MGKKAKAEKKKGTLAANFALAKDFVKNPIDHMADNLVIANAQNKAARKSTDDGLIRNIVTKPVDMVIDTANIVTGGRVRGTGASAAEKLEMDDMTSAQKKAHVAQAYADKRFNQADEADQYSSKLSGKGGKISRSDAAKAEEKESTSAKDDRSAAD